MAGNLSLSLVALLGVGPKMRKYHTAFEKKLRESATLKKSLGKTYEERLAEEYKKRGLSG